MTDNSDGGVDVSDGILLGILGAAAILLFQCYPWARTGEWVPLSVASVLGFYPDYLYYPTDWVGLAKIGKTLLELPLSLVALFVFWLGGWIAGWAGQETMPPDSE